MNKILIMISILLFVYIILSCDIFNSVNDSSTPSPPDSSTKSSPVIIDDRNDEPKCIYEYFLNDRHELDSNIVECPDIKPHKQKVLHPLNIDSVKIYNIG